MRGSRFLAWFTVPTLLAAACGENLTPSPTVVSEGFGLDCVPNLDGQIEGFELQSVGEATASYLVNPVGDEVAIDQVGLTDQAGVRVWDWSEARPNDQRLEVAVRTLRDQWYAAAFAGGEFVTNLDAGGAFEAVYSHDDTGLYLHGFASPEQDDADGMTLVSYARPVALYRFPIAEDKRWAEIGEVRDATLRGLPYAGDDVYETSVDRRGELWLEGFRFTDVYRVRTKITSNPIVGDPVSRRQTSFVAECFGEVARAVSRDAEEDADFRTAIELRRFTLE